MSKGGFVYGWYDRKHSRYYLGSHWGTLNDGYICGSRWMCKAYRKRPGDFTRHVLEFVNSTRQDLYEAEGRWLATIPEVQIGNRFYNLKKTAHGGCCQKHSEDTKQKMRVAALGRKVDDKTRQRMSITKRQMSDETKQKLRDIALKQWVENRESLCASMRGRSVCEEACVRRSIKTRNRQRDINGRFA